MAKKVKCIECEEYMNWSLPVKVGKQNIEYAKHCLSVAKRSFVCGRTMKTKPLNNEQYCKHFCKGKNYNDWNSKRIEELEAKIKEFEALAEMGE